MGMVVHVKWEPFRDLMAMQDRMTRLFDETLSRIWKEEVPRGVWAPPVDILEKGNEVILKIDLPEMDQNEIDIKVEENTLIIQGERKFIKETTDTNYLQIERPYGTFQRTFAVPRGIDQEKIKASYKDGVLRVVLPKREIVHPKKILLEGEGD
jgi:HSP20 family protein